MNETEQRQISDANEDHVRKWFEASGFVGEKLDTGGNEQGKSADWRFSKHDLAVICEVKTIFSGGQSGLTPEQYERRRLEAKRKFDYYKAQAIGEGIPLIAFKEELDYLEGKIAYSKQSIRREAEFSSFLADIRNQLQADQTINQLPFSVSISIDGMYVAYRREREQFVEWLKGFVLWAQVHHNAECIHSTSTFSFRDRSRAEDGTIQNSIEAFVLLMPLSYPQLQVGFNQGGGSFNEAAIADTIADAVSQLRASISREATSAVLPVIGLWSVSSYLNFSMLLRMDVTGAQLHDLPERYYLFDWAFSEYPDLAAIVLFELHREGDPWNPTPNDKIFPVGCVITNPNLPDAERALKAALTENCGFITGMASDPLSEPIK